MPINTIRLNHQKHTHPNDRIIFIKPLPRPAAQQSEYDVADTFLRAIAAQCLPVTKKHWLSVTTLEEFEPNREFMGRNFNHGECIQLVLRSKSGGWLPFNMVQMVMMHELAHNVEMNHSKRFWAKRNEFAAEMRELWAKGYTGEGFWGSGKVLGEMDSVMAGNVVRSEELGALPLCGGTYRSRRRKRRTKAGVSGKEELTWREKKERRIEKKFGKNGVGLGSDEDARMLYELGKGPVGGNPRVAQSKRGRELRAAAALARLEQSKQAAKKEEEEQADKVKEEDEVDSDDYEDGDAGIEDATDLNGERLVDTKGQSMIRVCGEEEEVNDVQVKRELEELEGLERYFPRLRNNSNHIINDGGAESSAASAKTGRSLYDIPAHVPTFTRPDEDDRRSDATTVTASPSPEPSSSRLTTEPTPSPAGAVAAARVREDPSERPASRPTPEPKPTTSPSKPPSIPVPDRNDDHDQDHGHTQRNSKHPSPTHIQNTSNSLEIACPICSLTNTPTSPTCAACCHVLDKRKDPRHWVCGSKGCRGTAATAYVNAGDAGVCGLCGCRRP